jgi:site-specific DNA-methyltransferase (adenine-specific)
MRQVVREAFLIVRDGNSPDVVITDPGLNQRFLDECRSRGCVGAPQLLNLCLLNLRKTGGLQGIQSKRSAVPDQDEYRFAAEIAVRFLERRDALSLDQILCDPARAAEFDQLAAQIAPGFSSFQYRWAALNLRKRKRLRPELLAKVVAPETVKTCKVIELIPTEIPNRSGLYLFIQPGSVLYIGECENLRKRISKHLEHSDNKGLAHWLWQHGTSDLHLEYHVLPIGVSSRVRKALEAELISSRNPVFNVAGTNRSK